MKKKGNGREGKEMERRVKKGKDIKGNDMIMSICSLYVEREG